jgi:hypothetical protein
MEEDNHYEEDDDKYGFRRAPDEEDDRINDWD